jgi:predicted aldo/keto reductase-like oxidoreductase
MVTNGVETRWHRTARHDYKKISDLIDVTDILLAASNIKFIGYSFHDEYNVI